MNEQKIAAVAFLLSEVLAAGVSIAAIMNQAKATGMVPPERWDQILSDLDTNVENWKNAPGG